ncbi:MAG TPA: cohesin domain-containing protein [Burkholderiales bacterium]|nr:cohesin domain-containing protein [Burkholderiales bacterium]
MLSASGPGISRRFAALAAALILAGCAGDQSYKEGLRLIDQGQYEQGLARLEQATQESPSDSRFRMALITNRATAAERLMAMGAAAEASDRPKEAEALYRRALGVDPSNPRAREALRVIEKADSQNEAVKQAQAALAKKDLDQASVLVNGVLQVNPRHKGAQAVQGAIEQARSREITTLPQLKSRFTKPVTLEFRDANVKMVFDVLSRTSGINFVFDKDVRPDTKVTIYVRNVAVEDAIDLLLIQSQLEKKVLSDNSVLIYPNTPQKLKEYQDLVIRTFYLGNGDAKQTLNLIKTIIKTKDVYVDDRLNMLVMRDTPEAIRLAEKLIIAQDLTEPEVLLEMEVLEINRRRSLDLGIEWPSTFTVLLPKDGSSPTIADLPFYAGRGISGTDIGMNINLSATLRQDNSLLNLISNPRIRVKNRDKARVLIGNREPVITSQVTPGATNPVVTESVQYLDIGVKLEIEPTILLDDEVSMKVNMEVSTKGDTVTSAQGNEYFAVNTRTVNTVLRLKDGETAVMMGFIQDDTTESRGGIPGLVDLPFLSPLFSSGSTDTRKNEIVFSITPRVVRNLKRLDAANTEYWSGTETSLRTKPPILQSAMPGTAIPAAPAAGGARPAAAAPAAAPEAPVAAAPATAPAQAAAPANVAPAADAAAPAAGQAPPAAPEPPPPPSGKPLALTFAAPPEAKVGDEVKVTLNADAPDPLMSLGLVLRYDATALQVLKVEEGSLFRQGGAATSFTENVNPGAGRVVVNIKREVESGAKGTGSVVTVTFKVTAKNDRAQVQLLSASPISQAGIPIRIQPSTPHALALKP